MRYNEAKKYHNEDEVMVKETGEVQRILQVEILEKPKIVSFLLQDGNWYGHTEVS